VLLQGNTAEEDGGGIDLRESVNIVIGSSAVYDNEAVTGDGGGVFVDLEVGDARFTNSTISSNHAGGDGGGVWHAVDPGDRTVFTHVTVADNDAGGTGGGVWFADGGGTAESSASLFARNSSPGAVDCGAVSGSAYTSLDHNIVENGCDASVLACTGLGASNDVIGGSCAAGVLALDVQDETTGVTSTGAPTVWHPLSPTGSSLPEDYVPQLSCPSSNDQLGALRPEPGGTECDVGAVEEQ